MRSPIRRATYRSLQSLARTVLAPTAKGGVRNDDGASVLPRRDRSNGAVGRIGRHARVSGGGDTRSDVLLSHGGTSSRTPKRLWLYVACDTSSARYVVSVTLRGPNSYRRLLHRGTPRQSEPFIDRTFRVPYRGWYSVVVRDYDPGTTRIPVHRGLDTARIYVY